MLFSGMFIDTVIKPFFKLMKCFKDNGYKKLITHIKEYFIPLNYYLTMKLSIILKQFIHINALFAYAIYYI